MVVILLFLMVSGVNMKCGLLGELLFGVIWVVCFWLMVGFVRLWVWIRMLNRLWELVMFLRLWVFLIGGLLILLGLFV